MAHNCRIVPARQRHSGSRKPCTMLTPVSSHRRLQENTRPTRIVPGCCDRRPRIAEPGFRLTTIRRFPASHLQDRNRDAERDEIGRPRVRFVDARSRDAVLNVGVLSLVVRSAVLRPLVRRRLGPWAFRLRSGLRTASGTLRSHLGLLLRRRLRPLRTSGMQSVRSRRLSWRQLRLERPPRVRPRRSRIRT